tara:strand:+ start:3771 stop:4832 length:1062 start_codon:yes stop_codon:yes gene_type:complete
MGAALVAAPFFIKSAPIVTDIASWMFFLKTFALLSIAFFGAKITTRTKVLGFLVFGAALTANNPFNEIVWHQFDYVACAFLLFCSIQNQNYSEKCVNGALAFVCLFSCLWLWLQKFGIDLHFEWLSLWNEMRTEIVKPLSYPVNGSLFHINHSLALIVATIPFLKKRFWAIPLATVLYFHTTLPLVMLFLGSFFYLYQLKSDRRYLYAALGLTVILAISMLFMSEDIGSNGRLAAWAAFFKWHGFNFFGEGYGIIQKEFSQVFTSVAGEKFHKLHNDFFEAYAIGGFAWIAAFVYMVKPIFKRNIPVPAATCCFLLLINSLGNFTFQIAPLLITFMVCYNLIIKGESNGSIDN